MVAHWHHRFTMQRHIGDNGHLMGWTVRPYPLVSPLMPFVYRVKGRLTKLDRARYSWGAVSELYVSLPTKNWIYLSQKGFCSMLAPPLNYSPGIRRKNNMIQVRSQMACCLGVLGWRMVSESWTFCTGRGQTLLGQGSAFLYEESCRPR